MAETPGEPHAVTPLGLAIVGTGKFARRVHIPNLPRVPGLRLRACMDLIEANAREGANKAGADYFTTDLARVLADPEVDVVLVGAPADRHVALSMAAARAGKAVFCEKPMGANLAECRALASVLDQTRTPYMLGYCYRFNAAVENLRPRLEPQMTTVHVHCRTGESTYAFFQDNVCHALDLLYFFHRCEPVEVQAAGNRPWWPGPVAKADGWMSVNVHFENGSLATIVAGPKAGRFADKWYYRFCGADGRVGEIVGYRQSRVLGEADTEFSDESSYHSGHLKELQLLADAVRKGRPPPVTARDGLRVNLMLEAVARSYESGAGVRLAAL